MEHLGIKQFDVFGKELKTWTSIDEVIKANKTFNKEAILSVCSHKRKVAHGFMWQFATTNNDERTSKNTTCREAQK